MKDNPLYRMGPSGSRMMLILATMNSSLASALFWRDLAASTVVSTASALLVSPMPRRNHIARFPSLIVFAASARLKVKDRANVRGVLCSTPAKEKGISDLTAGFF